MFRRTSRPEHLRLPRIHTRAQADAFTSNALQRAGPIMAMQATSQIWSRAGNFNDGCGEGTCTFDLGSRHHLTGTPDTGGVHLLTLSPGRAFSDFHSNVMTSFQKKTPRKKQP